ncbi:MAG: hypothetical protein PHC34_07865 [Candidatus Gastranaerophilales bacterium]|nr:hypothetical protein [Candidatus Gastranaerophilales bacterium]
MTFSHYAKIKRILEQYKNEWIIKRIDQPTKSQNFKKETIFFDHYYRIYDASNNQPIKYCKFQQIERLAMTLGVHVEELPISE